MRGVVALQRTQGGAREDGAVELDSESMSLPWRGVRLAAAAAAAVLVSACAITPEPLTDEERAAQATENLALLTKDQEPVAGPISMHEAMARALKYNLDYRLELMEEVLADKELNISHYDLLPRLVARAGYDGRDEFNAARSQQLDAAVALLPDNYSSSRDVFSADLQLSWNVLDFGLSYVRGQQAADQYLIAQEQKRKVVHRIVQDVRAAYWRAVSEQRLRERMAALRGRVDSALAESKQVSSKRLSAPLRALTYQRELLDIRRQIEELERDLSLARTQLAALMNLRPGENYSLVLPARTNLGRPLPWQIESMETLALQNRPEMREVSYERRINAKEARAAVLQLLPDVNFFGGLNANSNALLAHQSWYSWGAQISWNLLNVVKLPATQELIESRGNVLQSRELALAMAVLTQVHVSVAQHAHAVKELGTAAEFYGVQSDILDQVRKGAQARSVSEQNLIREELNALLAEVRYDVAYADTENALAGATESIGVDPLPATIGADDVNTLAEALRTHLNAQ